MRLLNRDAAESVTIVSQETNLRGAPMRDLLLTITPMAAIVYFLVYPDQFKIFMHWFATLL